MDTQYDNFVKSNPRYAEFIGHEDRCGEGWYGSDAVSKDSGIGMACMLAYIDGCKPTLEGLADTLNLDPKEVEKPYVRLLRSGLFSYAHNARNDEAMLNVNLTESCVCVRNRTVYDEWVSAWCHVAGVAAGLIERNIHRNKSHLNFARYRNRR